jgi:hypothetical protein
VNVNGLKLVPRYLPDMVCMTLNERTATPHASGKTKSQPKTNNRKDSLPIWVKLTTTSECAVHHVVISAFSTSGATPGRLRSGIF